MGVVKQRGDGRHPAGISGEDAVTSHVAVGAVNMKLLFQLLHGNHHSFPL